MATSESLKNLNSDVAIVSAFGRGHWLACELASHGWRVTLADVSEELLSGGMSSSQDSDEADCEGPFGLLESDDLKPAQKSSFNSGGHALEISGGVTFWLNDGPVELRGPMAQEQMARTGLSKAAIQYLSRIQSKGGEREVNALLKEPFRETWLVHFAHQWAALVHREHHRAAEVSIGVPIANKFSVRHASRRAWKEALANCIDAGVNVRSDASIRDLRMAEARTVDALEIDDASARAVERARAFVWTLSSLETQHFPKSVFNTIFPNGAVKLEWYWQRLSFKLDGSRADDALPRFIVVIQDPFLPWTHANLIVLRAREEDRTFDAWVKLPIRVRSDAVYLRTIASEVEAHLKRRMPLCEPRLSSAPNASAVEKSVWAPVFNEESLKGLHALRSKNFFFCGPETWPTLDPHGLYRSQELVLEKLQKLKHQWDAQARREAAREASP